LWGWGSRAKRGGATAQRSGTHCGGNGMGDGLERVAGRSVPAPALAVMRVRSGVGPGQCKPTESVCEGRCAHR